MSRPVSRRRAPVDVDADDGDYEVDDDKGYGDDEDARPSRGRSSTSRRSSRDEDERPSRSSSRRSSSRRGSREDEEDSSSRRSSRRGASRSGGGSSQNVREKLKAAKARASKFNKEDRFTVDEDTPDLVRLFHFLEEDPIDAWSEHWVEGLGKGKKNSYFCLQSLGKDCPLCDYGLTSSYRAAYNIVVFDKNGNPHTKYWIVTPDPADEIDKKEKSLLKKDKGLNDEGTYFLVSKSRKGRGAYSYDIEAIAAEDLQDDFELEPLTADELDDHLKEGFESKDVVRPSTYDELDSVVEELED